MPKNKAQFWRGTISHEFMVRYALPEQCEQTPFACCMFLAMHLITPAKNGMSSLALSRQFDISENSAWPRNQTLM